MLRRVGAALAARRALGRAAPSYAHRASRTPLRFETLAQAFRDAAHRWPQRALFAFRQQGLRRSYAQVYQDALRFAHGLAHLGLRRGDRVGVWAPNYYEWTVSQFACAIAGVVQVNVNPAYQASELQYALQKVGVKALITMPKFKATHYYEILCGFCPKTRSAPPGVGHVESRELPDLKHLIIFDPDRHDYQPSNGAWSMRELMTAGGSEDVAYVDECMSRTRPDDPVNIQYTSGTTGIQKAAVLTNFGILNSAYFTGLDLGMDENTRLCLPNPLFHCFGCVIGTVTLSLMGGSVHFPAPWFRADCTALQVAEDRCNTIYGTPTMFVDILDAAQKRNIDISSLRRGAMGGSPCPIPLLRRFVEVGMTELVPIYGMTEMSSTVTVARWQDPPADRVKHVGWPIAHTELAVVDEQGHVVPRGDHGEIWCRSFGVMREYYDMPDATDQTIVKERWLRSGDMGYMNEDGSVVISGRLKEMIIRGGENIYPAEIEQFLFKHPAVLNAYVVGIPDDRWGEEVCAVIRLKEGQELSEAEVKAFCKGRISHYKVPKYVLFKDDAFIPMTPSGKVRKFLLARNCCQALGKERADPFQSD